MSARCRRNPLGGHCAIKRNKNFTTKFIREITKMAVPDKIKIIKDDYRFEFVGKYNFENQFMAFITASLPNSMPQNWQEHKRWYAIIHKFNSDGIHIDTEHFWGGTTADGEDNIFPNLENKLGEMVSQLNDLELGEISVKPFQIEIDGRLFGLIYNYYEEDDEGHEWIELEPNGVVFYSPWEGDYDT